MAGLRDELADKDGAAKMAGIGKSGAGGGAEAAGDGDEGLMADDELSDVRGAPAPGSGPRA